MDKNQKLIEMLYSHLNDEQKELCELVINYLLELGYSMKKYKNSQTPFAIQFKKPGITIARIGIGKQSVTGETPFLFMLKYNASDNYSEKFQYPLRQTLQKYQSKTKDTKRKHFPTSPTCGVCTLCDGKPQYYRFTSDDGETFTHCAGFMMNINDLTMDDFCEIKRHIRNQNDYTIS